MRFLICLVVFLSASLLSSVSFSADRLGSAVNKDRFAACRTYQPDIDRAVRKYFPLDFQYPDAMMAQIYQESLCDRFAVSPAGAQGLGQIMPATMPEIRRAIKFSKSPFSISAISPAVYYQGKMMSGWTVRRTPYQRWQLGLASYNSGFGSVLKSQKKCGNARLWDQIKYCQFMVTGKNAEETITYVSRIIRWWTELAGQNPQSLAPELSRFQQDKLIKKIKDKYDVRRYFSGSAWGSYWRIWGGWITADHVYTANLGATPYYARGEICRSYGEIDAVLYGGALPATTPRSPMDGERVYILGYPGGSDKPSLRTGRVLFQRTASGSDIYTYPAWIVVIDNPPKKQTRFAQIFANTEPVIGGMSGGLVVSHDMRDLGVLVTQNGRADLNNDGILDDSADFSALSDIWKIFKQECDHD
ncbi:MAG: transglycosylase SLT domain-containing protein [Robiginitomaculum sp.]|nr:transglycosylase SLT domain-containing protein [Robiginitomaculum sp.]